MLETAKEGTKAATKLMEIVQKFLGPYWTKKTGRRRCLCR